MCVCVLVGGWRRDACVCVKCAYMYVFDMCGWYAYIDLWMLCFLCVHLHLCFCLT